MMPDYAPEILSLVGLGKISAGLFYWICFVFGKIGIGSHHPAARSWQAHAVWHHAMTGKPRSEAAHHKRKEHHGKFYLF
ncbi:MAG: hypothetical protein H6R04_1924 [Burkholderiaceae bacterium]|nr:hypothetical protein [Burkholderiaceae bacterium]